MDELCYGIRAVGITLINCFVPRSPSTGPAPPVSLPKCICIVLRGGVGCAVGRACDRSITRSTSTTTPVYHLNKGTVQNNYTNLNVTLITFILESLFWSFPPFTRRCGGFGGTIEASQAAPESDRVRFLSCLALLVRHRGSPFL